MVKTHVTDGRPGRPDDPEVVTIPRRVLCELAFCCGQLRSRLEALAPDHSRSKIDAAVIDNASVALTNARAALALATQRP